MFKKTIAVITAAAFLMVSSYVPTYAYDPETNDYAGVYVASGDDIKMKEGIECSAESKKRVGALVEALETGDATLTVSGDVSIDYVEEKGASTDNAGEKDTSSDIDDEVEVDGVSVKAGNSDVNNTGKASAIIDGDISASFSGTESEGYVYGFDLISNSTGGAYGEVGAIDVTASNGCASGARAYSTIGEAELNVGNITATGDIYANGIYVTSGSVNDLEVKDAGCAKATVDGSVMVKNGNEAHVSASAIGAQVDTEVNGRSNLTITGDVSADSKWTGIGLYAANSGGQINADIAGDITATNGAEKLGEEYAEECGQAYGVYAFAVGEESETSIQINGDVTAESEEEAYGVYVATSGKDLDTSISIDGNVKADGNNANGIFIDSYEYGEGSNVNIEVRGAVESDGTGLCIEGSEDVSGINYDVIVDGTLSGKEKAVSFSGVVSEDITLTAWEVKPNEDGNLVERCEREEEKSGEAGEAGEVEEAELRYIADREFEKNIQYIIKVDPAQQKYISLAGTGSYKWTDAVDGEVRSYDVAREGDKVVVKIGVPEGYEISHAFCDMNDAEELKKDSEGNYYLEVPKGGGVYLSCEFEKIPEPKPEPESVEYRDITGSAVVAKQTVQENGEASPEDFVSATIFWISAYDKNFKEVSDLLRHLLNVLVDGFVVPLKDQQREEGSIIIRLSQAYINTLSVGEHTLTAEFDNGDPVNIKFTVVEAEEATGNDAKKADIEEPTTAESDHSPQTGDDAALPYMLLLMIGSALPAAFITYKKKKSNS